MLICVMGRRDTGELLVRARGIATLRGVLNSSVVQDLLAPLEERLLSDAWQSHLVGRVLDDENPFSLGAERGEINRSVLEQARRDLRTLREMFALDAAVLFGRVESAVPALAG